MTENDKLKLDNQLCFSLYALSREVIKMYQPVLSITLAPHQCKYDAAEHQTDANAGEHGLLGAFFIASTHVLGHKGCHGLHQRTGDQHGKINDLARHTVAGRCLQPQPVDEGAERQKGKLGQKLLQSQRQTDAQKFFALGVQLEIRAMDFEGQLLLQQHCDCTDYADGLCCYRSNGGTGSIQMKTSHQHQIANNIHNARHQHKDQRRAAVAQTAEKSREHIIGYNKEDAAAANAHIAGGQVQGFGRSLHQTGNKPCKKHQHHEQCSCQKGEHNSCPANDLPDVLRSFFAQIAGNEHCDTHGKLGDNKGDEVEYLTTGGNRRQA